MPADAAAGSAAAAGRVPDDGKSALIQYAPVHSFTRSFVHSFAHSFIHSFIRSFIHSFIHPFIHSFVRSFIILVSHVFHPSMCVRPCVPTAQQPSPTHSLTVTSLIASPSSLSSFSSSHLSVLQSAESLSACTSQPVYDRQPSSFPFSVLLIHSCTIHLPTG